MREECTHFQSRTYCVGRGRPLLRARPGPRGAVALSRELPLVPSPAGRRGLGARESGRAGPRGRARGRGRERGGAARLGRGHRERGGARRARVRPGRRCPPGAGRRTAGGAGSAEDEGSGRSPGISGR